MSSVLATTPVKEPGQITFSAIGDVYVAVDQVTQRGATAPSRTSWAGMAACALMAYLAGLAGLLSLDAPPRAGALLRAPLAPALVCLVVAWSRARWKARARIARAELKATQRAMESLAHETAAGLDAIRAHWIGLRAAKPDCSGSAHFSHMSLGADRIGAALRRLGRPQPR